MGYLEKQYICLEHNGMEYLEKKTHVFVQNITVGIFRKNMSLFRTNIFRKTMSLFRT